MSNILISKEKAKEIINRLIDNHKKISDNYDKLYEIFSASSDCSFFDSIFKIEEDYIEFVEYAIGDNLETILWYIFDNNCGEDECEAEVNGKKRKIKNVDDLIWLIYEGKEE